MLLNTYKHHHTESLFILLYLCPCLGLFMSYLCDPFFIFIFIFVMFNCIISWMQKHLFFWLFFRILILEDNLDEECQYLSNSKRSALSDAKHLHDFFANFSLTLLKKLLLIKKVCMFVECFEKFNHSFWKHFIKFQCCTQRRQCSLFHHSPILCVRHKFE